MTQTHPLLEEDVVDQIITETDKTKVAHYVISPNNDESNHAYVMRARVEGFPVEALCGYTWIPYQNATQLPVCQECEEISKNYSQGDGSNPRE